MAAFSFAEEAAMDAIVKAIAQSTATGWVANRFREAAGLPPVSERSRQRWREDWRHRRYARLMHQRYGALDRAES